MARRKLYSLRDMFLVLDTNDPWVRDPLVRRMPKGLAHDFIGHRALDQSGEDVCVPLRTLNAYVKALRAALKGVGARGGVPRIMDKQRAQYSEAIENLTFAKRYPVLCD